MKTNKKIVKQVASEFGVDESLVENIVSDVFTYIAEHMVTKHTKGFKLPYFGKIILRKHEKTSN